MDSDTLYTPSYLDFMESSERTGLLYELALRRFNEGQVIINDDNGHEIITPIITKEEFIDQPNIKIDIDGTKFEDIDDVWMDRVFKRLEYQNAGDIWNGDVIQVNNISDKEIQLNESNYFTLMSHHEKYVSDIAKKVYDNKAGSISEQSKTIGEVNNIYSLMGITYTTIIDPPSEDSKYLIYGKRSPEMNELSSFRVVAPAGIVQPRHIEGNTTLDGVIQSHLSEEFPEELLHEKLTEEEFIEHLDQPYVEYSFNGIGLEPLRYATELAVSVTISGEFAKYLLNNISTNDEMVNAKVYDISNIKTVYNPVFAQVLTPQSLFSLGLYLEKEFPEWSISIEQKPHL